MDSKKSNKKPLSLTLRAWPMQATSTTPMLNCGYPSSSGHIVPRPVPAVGRAHLRLAGMGSTEPKSPRGTQPSTAQYSPIRNHCAE